MNTVTEILGEICQNGDLQIPVEEYRYILSPDGQPTGYIRRIRGLPIMKIVQDLTDVLESESLIDEYFGLAVEYKYRDDKRITGGTQWPDEWPADLHHIACYAVTGSCEGHRTYIDLLYQNRHIPIAGGKTFRGMEHAWKIAQRCAELLGA